MSRECKKLNGRTERVQSYLSVALKKRVAKFAARACLTESDIVQLCLEYLDELEDLTKSELREMAKQQNEIL